MPDSKSLRIKKDSEISLFCQSRETRRSSSKYLARRGIRRRSRVNPLSSGPLRRETPSWEIARSGGDGLWKARSEGAGGVFRKRVRQEGGEGEVLIRFPLVFPDHPPLLRGAKTQDAGLGARDRAKEGSVSLRRGGESGDQLVSERGTSLYFGSPRERITSRSCSNDSKMMKVVSVRMYWKRTCRGRRERAVL